MGSKLVVLSLVTVVCLPIVGRPAGDGKEKGEKAKLAQSRFLGVGQLLTVNIPDALPTLYEAFVGDIIRLQIDKVGIEPGSLQSDLVAGSGDALSRMALVDDDPKFAAYYVAEKQGSATVSFAYRKAAAPDVILFKAISFRINSRSLSKIIVADVETATPNPIEAQPGDVIRFKLRNAVDMYQTGILYGDAVKKVSVLDEAGFLVAYYSAERVGRAAVTFSFRPTAGADAGAIFLVNVTAPQPTARAAQAKKKDIEGD